VREQFIALAREGVFGMHPTLLPRHRGRAPIPWAILSGLARTGVTLFEIVDATADSGMIVGQTVVEIAPDETATTLFERIADAHVELVRECVPMLLVRTAPPRPQDTTRTSSRPKRTPADGIIDWDTRAPYLDDWVRRRPDRIPVRLPTSVTRRSSSGRHVRWNLDEIAPAGTIVATRAEGPVVACEGALLLEDVETRAPELGVGARLG
jgi:methionyl-tRNA formyltransferase